MSPHALLIYREKPLAMYVFSKDKSVSDKLLHNTTAGGVCVNDTIMQSSGQFVRLIWIINNNASICVTNMDSSEQCYVIFNVKDGHSDK